MLEYLLPLLMLTGLLLGIFSGYPVAILLGGLALIFALVGGIPTAFLGTLPGRIFTGTLANWLMLAIPLFVFMGIMLDRSNIAKRLMLSLESILANRPGGLALAVTFLGIIMAASTGIVGASVVMMGMMALPIMLQQNYNKSVASGVVAATGTLGILIPPSIMLVLLGDLMQVSVGDLFMGALIPGLMLGLLYVIYIIVLAKLRPELMPAGQADTSLPRSALIRQFMKDLVLPALLIFSVLGSIIIGIATPTEAAAVGAIGATLLAFVTRSLSLNVLAEAVRETTLTTAMILFIAIGATAFSVIFKQIGGSHMIEDMVEGLGLGPQGTVLMVLLIIFVLGFFLEWIEISYIILPIFGPIVASLDLGFGSGSENLVWFAVLMAVNMQTSFLTPPLGFALFYLKGIAPPEFTIGDLYRGIVPFVLLQLLALALIFFFPALATWLPSAMAN